MDRRHAAVLGVLLLVGGCSGDPEPRVAPSPSASLTTPSPVVESTTAAPQPWEEKTADGAVAFAEHWVDVFNEAQADGQVGDLVGISSPGCGTCASVADRLSTLYAGGGRIESNGWNVESTSPTTTGLPRNRAQVAMRIDRTPQKVFTSEGVEKFPGSPVTLTAQMQWSAGTWSMKDLVIFE